MEQTPTKEEIMASLKEMIDVKRLQVELQELNTKIAVARAEELRALQFQAQIVNPKPENTQVHTVTQEDLDNNPDMVEAGLEVGEEILIPANAPKEKKLKKK